MTTHITTGRRPLLFLCGLLSLLLCRCDSAGPAPEPRLALSATALTFAAGEMTHRLTIHNQGEGTLSWQATPDQPWLEVSPASGEASDSMALTLRLAPELLEAGTHTASIQFSSNGGDRALTVTALVAMLGFSEARLVFEDGGPLPPDASGTLTVSNTGSGALSWTAQPQQPWIRVTPASGQGGDLLTVNVDRALLTPGVHNGSVRFTSNGDTQDLSVQALIAELLLPETGFDLGALVQAQTFEVINNGAGLLNWSVEGLTAPWLTLDPMTGENDASLTLTADRGLLPTGSHGASFDIASTAGRATVRVSLSVLPTATFTDGFDTSLSAWNVQNAIAQARDGRLELTGSSAEQFGTAEHSFRPVLPAPWAYRAALGRANAVAGTSSLFMRTNDTGAIIVPAFRFDITTDSDEGHNWRALAFVFNVALGQGGWGFLDADARGFSSRIQTAPDVLNDLTWVMTADDEIEIYVDGALFYRTDVLQSLNIGTISTDLEEVGIWTTQHLTTLADWALVREEGTPGKRHRPALAPTEVQRRVLALARQRAVRHTRDGTWGRLPTLRQRSAQLR